MFKICARTVLELGAELISSDVIAFYELIKNAFDAKSPSGAEIRFEITLRRNDYLALRHRASESSDLGQMKSEIDSRLCLSAPKESLSRVRQAVQAAKTKEELLSVLDEKYADENRIIVSDEGTGMSKQDLVDNYLVIGTASRKRAIDAALTQGPSNGERPPYLGEKGIGRLSAMRLGERLTVETAEKSDERLNVLRIDWTAFEDLDAMLDEINIVPEVGDVKPKRDWSGTRLTISSLSADWPHDRVKDLGVRKFAQLTDPFADARRRPRIAIFWNGDRVPIAHMDHHLLENAHAFVKGRFVGEKGISALECEYVALDLGFGHPREVERREIQRPDLIASISGTSGKISPSALDQLGSLEFEAYWFNRRRLGGIDSVGDRKVVQELQRRWSGILLFRDGFRVLPYGEDEDDWLALDRRALGSTGYLLNKAQFVGRVTISRIGNPRLVDQTNREGLRVCPEQEAFVSLLQLVMDQLRDFLKDVQSRHKDQPLDLTEAKIDTGNLVSRAKAAIQRIRKEVPAESDTVDELHHTLMEIKGHLDEAHQQVTHIERDSRQMIQMAGVGLMVEVVAHELARSSENALVALEALRHEQVPQQIQGLLESLRSEMKAVSKRVRVLDPLSVSGRQRKETFDICALFSDVLSGHEVQFARHRVQLQLTTPGHAIRVRAVKGMIVQIIENLVSNSLYWVELRRQHEANFTPCITIGLHVDPLTIIYEDNGRGIARENRENIFRAFFSLKEKSKRRGLGLFIARDCAEYHGGTLSLDDHINQDTGRLHRFVLELPDEVVVS